MQNIKDLEIADLTKSIIKKLAIKQKVLIISSSRITKKNLIKNLCGMQS